MKPNQFLVTLFDKYYSPFFCKFQSQYKFIYRAISDYVDLYRNKDDDEYAYSVPVNSVNNGGTLPPAGSRTPAGAVSTAGSSKSGTLNSKKSK